MSLLLIKYLIYQIIPCFRINPSIKYYGYGQGKRWLIDRQCYGTEAIMLSCLSNTWGFVDCDHSDDVGIDCYNGRFYTHCPALRTQQLYVFVLDHNFSINCFKTVHVTNRVICRYLLQCHWNQQACRQISTNAT